VSSTLRHNPVGQYLVVTASYWAFTLSDGALRMLVVLFFHELGYSPLEVASLFLLYEFFGMVTNLFGGWLASRFGLNMTMNAGLFLQIVALAMLLAEPSLLTIPYVMLAQAFSGIAKDLNKMSAKSSIKALVKDDGGLYRWVALLTGSKNALKGMGFFLGGALLAGWGFRGAIAALLALLSAALVLSAILLEHRTGIASFKPKFRDIFSKSPAINRLSAARFFLFASRDIWFVVALPVYLQSQLGWSYLAVGSLLALWVIAYGAIQAFAPRITGAKPDGGTAFTWASILVALPAAIGAALLLNWQIETVLVLGLLIFGVVFAVNSSVHSYLIVAWARQDGVSLDVGFYYMANAAGRLAGTILSGLIYQQWGLAACLFVSAFFVLCSAMLARKL
jgi:predicted MFS family arabinose efflux permease